jgi:hypothetical protein
MRFGETMSKTKYPTAHKLLKKADCPAFMKNVHARLPPEPSKEIARFARTIARTTRIVIKTSNVKYRKPLTPRLNA